MVDDAHDPLLRAIGRIINRGCFGLDEIETLRAAAADKADVANCRLAGHTLAWIVQHSARPGHFWRAEAEPVN